MTTYPEDDAIYAHVMDQLFQRRRKGAEKYGKSVMQSIREDGLESWARQLLEEALDTAVYAQALLEYIKEGADAEIDRRTS